MRRMRGSRVGATPWDSGGDTDFFYEASYFTVELFEAPFSQPAVLYCTVQSSYHLYRRNRQREVGFFKER